MGRGLKKVFHDDFCHGHDLTTLPKCYNEVWQSQRHYNIIFASTALNDDTDLKAKAKARFNEMVRGELATPRGEDCYFYATTQNGMTLEAARELEKRATNRREAAKDRKYTRTTINIALGALAFSIFATLATLVWNIWAHYHPAAP